MKRKLPALLSLVALLLALPATIFLVKRQQSYQGRAANEDSPYGINDVVRYTQNEEIDEKTLTLANQMGAKWTRYPVDWKRVEPNDNDFRFDQLDEQLEAIKNHDIIPYIMIGQAANSPNWITSAPDGTDNNGYPPRNDGDWKSWRDFVRNLVTRYGCGSSGKCLVTHWEIWSEEEGACWREKGYGDVQYVNFLKAAHEEIKKVDPNAKIILGRFKGEAMRKLNTDNFNKQNDVEARFIKNLFDKGVGQYFDIVSLGGPYDCDWSKHSNNAMQKWYNNTIKLLQHYQLGKKPVWITETGCSTDIDKDGVINDSEREQENKQALDLKVRYQLAINIGFSKVFWRHFEENPGRGWKGFYGIVRRDTLEPKPAYFAYQTMASSKPTPTPTPLPPLTPTPAPSNSITGFIWIDNNGDGRYYWDIKEGKETVYSCSGTQTKPKLEIYQIGTPGDALEVKELNDGNYTFSNLLAKKYHLRLSQLPVCNGIEYQVTKWQIKTSPADGSATYISLYDDKNGTTQDAKNNWTDTPFWSLKVNSGEITRVYLGIKPK
jgi:hypothetical protein